MTKTVNKSKKAVNQKSIKNLKPFSKGQSGNPSGRKPIPADEKLARQIIKDMNEELVKDLISTGRYKALLTEAIEKSCQLGKVDGLKFINDYVGNKPMERMEHTGNDDKPIVITTTMYG
jgi:hypothetical protein